MCDREMLSLDIEILNCRDRWSSISRVCSTMYRFWGESYLSGTIDLPMGHEGNYTDSAYGSVIAVNIWNGGTK